MERRFLFWIMVFTFFVFGLFWGMVIGSGIDPTILPPLTFFVFGLCGLGIYTGFQAILGIDAPLGASGFFFLFGVMILGGFFITANPVTLVIGLVGIFVGLLIEYLTIR